MGKRVPLARASATDLMDSGGRFKRPADLPMKVRRELDWVRTGTDGRISAFRFKDRFATYRLSAKRRGNKHKVTQATEKRLVKLLDLEVALYKDAASK